MIRLGNVITAAATVSVAAAVFLATPARAGEVRLWACHGASGRALGAAPFTASASRDGRTREYGVGCRAEGAGGVEASFSRADPEGGSGALWQLAVPGNVTLRSLRIGRATSGFGGAPVLGDPQRYEARTSSGPIESASLESGDAAVTGVLEAAAAGPYVRLGVGCWLAPGERCAAPPSGTVGVELSSIALGVLDESRPAGAVGGVRSPVREGEALQLSLDASETGLGLANAEAFIDGRQVAFKRLGAGACPEHPSSAVTIDLPLGATGCPQRVAEVALPVSWSGVPAGSHVLRVTATGAAGNTRTLIEQTIDVRAPAPSGSNTLSVGIFAGRRPPPPPPPSPPPGEGKGHRGCPQPRLRMHLAAKPLWYTPHKVPVLRYRFPYPYRGRLTCLLSGRRVPAPNGTPVHVYYRIWKHSFWRHLGPARLVRKAAIRVAHRRLYVRLGFPSGRMLIFRYRNSAGESAEARLRIAIAPRSLRGPLAHRRWRAPGRR